MALAINPSSVDSFGRKIFDVEADVWVVAEEKILFDMKHTIGTDPIESISSSLIQRWNARLLADDSLTILIPVNQPPASSLLQKFRDIMPDRQILDRIDFVVMPGIL